MKKLIALLIGLLLVTGCPSTQTDSQCANWENAIRVYEVALSAGHKPSEDETRIYTAAKALFAVYCSKTAEVVEIADLPSGEKDIGTLPWPKQPKRIVTTETGRRINYYLHTPFSIIQDPTGIYPTRDGLATITIGPLYRTADEARRQYLWTPDAAWLQGIGKVPTMLPIR